MLLAHTVKYFYKIPLFMPFPLPRDNILSFFSTYPKLYSLSKAQARCQLNKDTGFDLLKWKSDLSFPGNLAVLDFDSFHHTFHTLYVLKLLLCLTLLSDRKSLQIENAACVFLSPHGALDNRCSLTPGKCGSICTVLLQQE